MWVTILYIVNGALDVGSKFLSWLSDEKLRQAGRNELRLKLLEVQVQAYAIAQEIDAKPTPDNRSDILKRLRRDP